jgi:hypothetical protein
MLTKNLLTRTYARILKRKKMNKCKGEILIASNEVLKKIAGPNTHPFAEEIQYGEP